MNKACPLLALTLWASTVATCWAAGEVQVTGTHNVGIGSMSGGKIEIGLSPQEAKALSVATGQELIAQLTVIVERLNVRLSANNKEQAISLGVVEGFLATVKGKRVPQHEWPQVFGELTRQWLELGARISATPVTSEMIERLVRRADEARKAGKLSRWLYWEVPARSIK